MTDEAPRGVTRVRKETSMTGPSVPGARIGQAFARARDEDRVALLPYVMTGYPDLETSEALALALAQAGADVIELGIPFFDPLADGVTIQPAGQGALDRGTNPGPSLSP